LQGGGGVVQYPRDFIKNAYEMIRAKGGVCVADEVNSSGVISLFAFLGVHLLRGNGALCKMGIVGMGE